MKDQYKALKMNKKVKRESALSVFKFCDWKDYLMVLVGIVFAIASAPCFPLITIVVGDFIKNMALFYLGMRSEPELRDDGRDAALNVTYLGCVAFGTSFLFCTAFDRFASRKSAQLEKVYLDCVMHQEIDWLDRNASGRVAATIDTQFAVIDDALGCKMGYLINDLGSFVTGMTLSFYFSWKIALIICSAIPILGSVVIMLVIALNRVNKASDVAKVEVDSLSEQTMRNIATVKLFNMTDRLLSIVEKNLVSLKRSNYQRVTVFAGCFAALFGIVSAFYPAIFYFGGKLIEKGDLDFAKLTKTFSGFLIGTVSLVYVAPSLQIMIKGRDALQEILTEIDTLTINSLDNDTGDNAEFSEARIEFNHVCFAYPSRPDVTVLEGLNLTIEPRKNVAIVGASGCGKSTIIQLLERFYQPNWGSIIIDGVKVCNMRVSKLRSQIGLVEQTPSLFTGTISQNIAWGLNETALTNASQEIKHNRVIKTCKQLNIHNIIKRLPNGYNTRVGEGGHGLSGGQRQLVAIARAIIKNPKILLLDEATSALDNRSEAIVQDALSRATQSRTTLTIAHKLNTIRNADKIVVLKEGRVAESGTHQELIQIKGGLYQRLVNNQKLMHNSNINKRKLMVDRKSKTISSLNIELAKHDAVTKRSSLFGLLLNPRSVSQSMDEDRKALLTASYCSDVPVEDVPELGSEKRISVLKTIWQLLKICAPHWFLLLVGLIAAVGQGFIFPISSWIIGEIFYVCSKQEPDMLDQINYWCIFIVILAGARFIGAFIQTFGFGIAGEALYVKLRLQLSHLIISQDMQWFEKPGNECTALMRRLVTEPDHVRELVSSTIGNFIQIMINLVLSSGLVIYLHWKFGLIAVVIIPVKLIADFLAFEFIGCKSVDAKPQTCSTTEAIASMRTVLSLNLTNDILNDHSNQLRRKKRKSGQISICNAVLYAFVQFLQVGSQAALIYACTQFIIDHDIALKDLMIVWVCAFISEKNAADGLTTSKSMTQGFIAARKVLSSMVLFKAVQEHGKGEKCGINPDIKGSIQFSDVSFRYPSRRERWAVHNINFKIPAGIKIGIVGESGSGKSTLISLLLDFYQLESGSIRLDDIDIRDYDPVALKDQISLVSQDISLFNMTIRENLLLGARNSGPTLSQDDIERATREANIHDFIASLPHGYDTRLDGKGAQLSGGQKQRIAIARALLRNPKIIIFDEATSALDSESEKQVKAAIDRISGTRTIISIAHRLTTIQDHDLIVVMHQGQIIKTGKFTDLKHFLCL